MKKQRRLLCMRAGTLKHEWTQHQLLCINDPEGCPHNPIHVNTTLPQLEAKVRHLQRRMERTHMTPIGCEVPVGMDLSKLETLDLHGAHRADLVVEYTGGPHRGKTAILEFKFLAQTLFERAKNPKIQRQRNRVRASHRRQAKGYMTLWNNSANVQHGECIHAFVVYVDCDKIVLVYFFFICVHNTWVAMRAWVR